MPNQWIGSLAIRRMTARSLEAIPGAAETDRGQEYHGPFDIKRVLGPDVRDGLEDFHGRGAAVRQ